MHVLFYSDVSNFGGHEGMTLNAIRYIAENSDWKITAVASDINERYLDALRTIENINIILLKHHGRRLQGFRSIIQQNAIREVQSVYSKVSPDAILFSQGDIEQCSVGLIAAKGSPIPTISYVPYAHSHKTMGSALWRLRDRLDPYYYSLPKSYITGTISMKEQLEAHGVTVPIEVVPPGFTPPVIKTDDRLRVRSELGISSNDLVIGLVGRIVYIQKGHDILADAITQVRKSKPNVRMAIFGDGVDLPKLKERCSKLGILESSIFQPWRKNIAEIYAAIDLLAIPSRFEGFPGVMLEAMAYSKPIAASDIHGMHDTLSKEWLFPVGNVDALVERILKLSSSDLTQELETNKHRALNEFSIERFGNGFKNAIAKCVSSQRK